MRIALSAMIDSVPACGEPLDRLLDLLRSYDIKATFFVATGPDRGLSFIKRLGGKGRIEQETSSLAAITSAGHAVGMASHDPVRWKQEAALASPDWIREQWQLGVDAWSALFGYAPRLHAACDYQVNPELFACEVSAGLLLASDTRGQTPFYPVMNDVRYDVLQLPVTLPSADELLHSVPSVLDHLHEELFDRSQKLLPQGQQWRFHVGKDDLDLLDKLVVMWRGTSKEFVTLDGMVHEFNASAQVRYHQVGWMEAGPNRYFSAQSLAVETGG